MQEKIDTDQGRRIYEQRLGMIEPVFCQYPNIQAIGSIYPQGKDKGEYSVAPLLYGA